MQFYTTIQDFTGVYSQQPFMQELRRIASKSDEKQPDKKQPDEDCTDIYWMDCSKINGTDCYCDDDAQAELNKLMSQALENVGHSTKNNARNSAKIDVTLPGIHFFDNGNYHYNSKLWTDCIQEPFDLVIFDHHPDMQPPRFEGILSCGGWVKEVLDHNPFIRNVVLIGVADHLIDEIKNEPSAEFEKYATRVTFVPESALREDSANTAIEALATLKTQSIYISIDKDALSLTDAVTNWDQGSLTFAQLEQTLRSLFVSHKILGVDICGERANNQDYADGMDEGTADAMNNELNKKLFNFLKAI
ncbi:MAG: arginase family protein [Fibrobacter sp.]|nr:arginase family protein [Fibrobacter sp.]